MGICLHTSTFGCRWSRDEAWPSVSNGFAGMQDIRLAFLLSLMAMLAGIGVLAVSALDQDHPLILGVGVTAFIVGAISAIATIFVALARNR
jgi:hypothetical protein